MVVHYYFFKSWMICYIKITILIGIQFKNNFAIKTLKYFGFQHINWFAPQKMNTKKIILLSLIQISISNFFGNCFLRVFYVVKLVNCNFSKILMSKKCIWKLYVIHLNFDFLLFIVFLSLSFILIRHKIEIKASTFYRILLALNFSISRLHIGWYMEKYLQNVKSIKQKHSCFAKYKLQPSYINRTLKRAIGMD